MESQTVFEKGWELDRLTVQNQLLRECELPVYQKLLEGKTNRIICTSNGAFTDVDIDEGLSMVKRIQQTEVDVLQAMTGI